MIDVIALVLLFQGSTPGTAAYFHKRADCEIWGQKLVLNAAHKQQTATFQCVPARVSKEDSKLVR